MYDNEDSICGIIYNNVPYYFKKNLQGDIIAIVDKDAKEVARYSYDAWGACTVVSASNVIGYANPFRYRGYYYDIETNLYYLNSRYFNPSIGKFVCLDDFETLTWSVFYPLSKNMYTYCGNNPIMGVDTNGYWNGWWNSVWFVARALDVIIIAVTGGIAIHGINQIKKFLRDNARKLVKNIAKQLMAMIGSTVANAVSSIVDIALTIFGTSIGDLIARAIDWCDPWWGKTRNNGYVFG